MSDQTMLSVAEAIHALPSPYPTVNLIKHYKGTTLNQQGRIIDINPASATIQASQRLTFHILLGMIHVRSGAFSGAISATIQPINYTDGTFHLSDLSYGGWRDRKTERVQPKCPTYVSMCVGRKASRVLMEDISNEGMGIVANKSIDPYGKLHTGVNLSLELQLSPWSRLIHMKGSVVYRKEIGEQLVKLGLRLFPDADQKKSLRSYIIQRYDEILHELEQEYIRMCEAYRVENQYF